MAEDPKANAVGEKCKKELRNWETSLKKRWGNLPQNLLAPQKRICPRRPERSRNLRNLGGTLVHPCWNLGGTSVQPWWNLPRNLWAAQDGSAPENHRESESNSAPKPLLWLKTPKLLLLGNKTYPVFLENSDALLYKFHHPQLHNTSTIVTETKQP